MEFTPLVTLLAVFLTLFLSMKVGGMRRDVPAPAITGNEAFERANRVHLNTVEQLVLFLPSLWLALPALGDHYAAGLGGVWLVGRILYARAYTKDPKTRGQGMMLTVLATLALWIAALAGVFGFAL